jgi:hypothetical protein
MSALDSSISWFTMQTIYGNWREENIFFINSGVTAPPTQMLLYAEKNTDILLRHQHRNYSATNRDITPPTTHPPADITLSAKQILHRHQHRHYSASNTYIILPLTQILHCHLHRYYISITQIFTLPVQQRYYSTTSTAATYRYNTCTSTFTNTDTVEPTNNIDYHSSTTNPPAKQILQ